MPIHVCYKEEGETPLAALTRLKRTNTKLKNSALTYLGRLDPMAEGTLLIGENIPENERLHYLALRKEYLVEILFGFSSDTYDVLGKLTDAPTRTQQYHVSLSQLLPLIAKLPGFYDQPYPPFSSKPASGEDGKAKPMYQLAREGSEPTVVPTKPITIHAARVLGMKQITREQLLEAIPERIKKVKGDFRQQESIACWEANLNPLYGLSFDIVSLQLSVSSGTYVRSIADALGKELDVPSLAYRIVRTKVGEYTAKHPDQTIHVNAQKGSRKKVKK